MVVDSLINPQTLLQPASFAGLMTLYESNFIRLQHLVPNIASLQGRRVSRVPGDCDLCLEALERTRYTTTLSMTYEIVDGDGIHLDPDMTLRVYFDGRLTEALSLGGQRVHTALREFAHRHRVELDRRWSRNIMLNKWLEYCLDRGHSIVS